MPPPSRSWTVITNGQVDADSPINDVLMSGMQGNLIHLEEWLGDGYVAAVDHDHDDTNSKLVATVADGGITEVKLGTSAVSQGKLKTTAVTSLAGSLETAANIILTAYCFFPMIHVNKDSGSGGNMTGHPTDGASENQPRFRLDAVSGSAGGAASYDVDYLHVAP